MIKKKYTKEYFKTKILLFFLLSLVTCIFSLGVINNQKRKTAATKSYANMNEGIINRTDQFNWKVTRISANSPILLKGNTSYHDSMGKRDVTSFYDEVSGNYYLYYGCIESLYNPSFENVYGAGTNGWTNFLSSISITTQERKFGQSSLRIQHQQASISGAYSTEYSWTYSGRTYKYPSGYPVLPNQTYTASVWVKAPKGLQLELHIQQYKTNPQQYSVNHLTSGDIKPRFTANGNWQRLVATFRTIPQARELTLSLIAVDTKGGEVTYWDGVQLERSELASDFPVNYKTYPIYSTVGWRICGAKSLDGKNWQELGQLELSEPPPTAWDRPYIWEEARSSSFWSYHSSIKNPANGGLTLPSVFKYNGKYYMNYLVSHCYATTSVNEKAKFDSEKFRIPATPYLTGLAVSDSPEGPFTRIYDHYGIKADNMPVIMIGKQGSWNDRYTSLSGSPFVVNGQWYSFFSGMSFSSSKIQSSIAISLSNTPLGPWEPLSSFNHPIIISSYFRIVENPVIIFNNAKNQYYIFADIERESDKYSSGNVTLTNNPLSYLNWDPRANIFSFEFLPLGSSGSWDSGGIDVIAPMFSKSTNKILEIYYIGRGENESISDRYAYEHMFHNIGLAEIEIN